MEEPHASSLHAPSFAALRRKPPDASPLAPHHAALFRAGDGILWLLLRHGPPALRAAVLPPLRATDIVKLAEVAPRMALAVAGDALPGRCVRRTARFRSVRFGAVRFGSVRCGSVRSEVRGVVQS